MDDGEDGWVVDDDGGAAEKVEEGCVDDVLAAEAVDKVFEVVLVVSPERLLPPPQKQHADASE